jgi:elongation factor P--(R)-beta-lysine ligase
VLVRSTVTDPQLASFAVHAGPDRYLQTSPEYAMKRLLAAGSGDIWQLARVFRHEERSALHNPEFTMVEWYRRGFGLEQMALETCQLVNALLEAAGRPARAIEGLHYRDALATKPGFDPLSAPLDVLRDACLGAGLAQSSARGATRDELLDFLMAVRVGPGLGADCLTWLHHYPASQAALARLDPDDPGTALRFEVYADGVELANGFVELASVDEQRVRFKADQAERRRRSLPEPSIDESLLAALEAGLPPCAGVALGFDRVAMLALGARRIDEVVAFGWDRA